MVERTPRDGWDTAHSARSVQLQSTRQVAAMVPQFHVASGLSKESDAKQVSTFLYCMGEEAVAVLTATHATVDDRNTYAAVKRKFDAFFKVRRNIILERAGFNRRNRQPGESAEQYIVTLYALAAN